MKVLGIRARLGLAAGAAVAIGSLFLAVPAWFIYRASLLETARTSLEVEAARVAESADEGLPSEGGAGHGRLLYAAILAENGEVLSSRGRGNIPAGTSSTIRRAVRGERASYVDPEALEYVAAAAPVAPEEDHSFPRAPRAVLLVSSTEELLGATRRIACLLGALLPLASVIAAMGAWFLAGRALKPVDALSRWASAVGERDLGGRIAVPRGDDEITRLARTLNAMLDRIEESFSRNLRFVADASHEIRNPLTNLSTEIQACLRRERDKGEYLSTLESTLDEVRRLSRLADGLLFLARSDAGKALGETVSVDLAELLAGARDAFRAKAEEAGVVLTVETEGMPKVEGELEALRRLVENLVENSVRYTPRGGRILLLAKMVEGNPMIGVTDSGMGIPESERAHLFERFWRGAKARERSPEGSGLGLAICREIASAHGGAIEVHPREGGGTRVEVIFRSS